MNIKYNCCCLILGQMFYIGVGEEGLLFIYNLFIKIVVYYKNSIDHH
jgi:hypothetical protein